MKVKSLKGLEILDSRGRPTVKAFVQLGNGMVASASVPSGASTGSAEAKELRDRDPMRYDGLGCIGAVDSIEGEMVERLVGQEMMAQSQWDQILIDLDGTSDKSRLGSNAILAVSVAYARAAAQLHGVPLYQYFSGLVSQSQIKIPRLTVNLFSGGKHAGAQVPFQDLLLVPCASESLSKSLENISKVYQAAVSLMMDRFNMRLLRADEGGLAPPFQSTTQMFEMAMSSIKKAGLVPGEDIHIAVDVAASHFYLAGRYHLDGQKLTAAGLIDYLENLQQDFPIISIEDGLDENAWQDWSILMERLGKECSILGDDFLCTQPSRMTRAISEDAANALLLKVNQVGTISEASTALKMARAAGWQVTVSARSGETEDTWLSDLAVGWRADFIKIGSITQSERLSKYNRLLEIDKWFQ